MRILILTASTGGGHNRASNALKDYINRHSPDVDVTIIDALKECSSILNYTVVTGYKVMVTLVPALYGGMYNIADKKSPLSDTVNIIYHQCARRLKPVIEEKSPDVIISCHPFAGAILGYMKEKYDYSIPLITIVTDFLPHRAYISEGIDAYVTASAKAKDILAERYKIDRGHIYDLGHPVYERFYEGNGRSREEVLDELGFDRDKPTVLIMAGSFGVSDILEIYQNLTESDIDFQVIVITGRNQKLYDAFDKLINVNEEVTAEEEPEWLNNYGEDNFLRELYSKNEEIKDKQTKVFRPQDDKCKPTKLFYFIDNVDDYMHASDLIVTKPGGLTTSESIACALPMVVFKAYPGQETQNASLLEENGIGVILEKSSDAADVVGGLLKDRQKLDAMRENCRRYVHKDSAQHIFELAQKLVKKVSVADNTNQQS